MLVEQGAIEERDGGWVEADRLAITSVPDSIHGVIAARLDLLESREREALRRCSVMGRVFWPSAVDVDDDLVASLGRRAIVSEQLESAFSGRREFTFKHALTHEVAYTTLPRYERGVTAPAGRGVARRRRSGASCGDDGAHRVPLRPGASLGRGRRGARDGRPSRRRSRPETRLRGAARTRPQSACSAARSSSQRDPEERSRALVAAAHVDIHGSEYERALARLAEVTAIADEAGRHEAPRRCAGLARACLVASRLLGGGARGGRGRRRDARRSRGVSGAGAGARAAVADPDAARAAECRGDLGRARSRSRSARASRQPRRTPGSTCSRPTPWSGVPSVRGDRRDHRSRGPGRRARRGGARGRQLPVVGRARRSDRTGRGGRQRATRRRLERGLTSEGYRNYLQLSLAALVYVPAGRWDEADAVARATVSPRSPRTGSSGSGSLTGQALRRGRPRARRHVSPGVPRGRACDGRAAADPSDGHGRDAAGGPCGRSATRRVAWRRSSRGSTRHFSFAGGALPIVRALAALGEQRGSERGLRRASRRRAPSAPPRSSTTATRGLLARLDGDSDDVRRRADLGGGGASRRSGATTTPRASRSKSPSRSLSRVRSRRARGGARPCQRAARAARLR